MADIETSLNARLGAFKGLTDLVGTRIYAMVLPQDEPLPAVTYQRISTVPVSALSVDDSLVLYHHQVNAWGKSYGDAHDVAEQVRLALQRYSHGDIRDVLLDEIQDDYDSETHEYRVIMDFRPRFRVANRAPTYDGLLSDYTLNRGSGGTATFTINNADSHFTDPDGDTLTFSVTGDNDTVATAAYAAGSVSLTHTTTGVVTVTLTATDPAGLSVEGTFTVTFTGVP